MMHSIATSRCRRFLPISRRKNKLQYLVNVLAISLFLYLFYLNASASSSCVDVKRLLKELPQNNGELKGSDLPELLSSSDLIHSDRKLNKSDIPSFPKHSAMRESEVQGLGHETVEQKSVEGKQRSWEKRCPKMNTERLLKFFQAKDVNCLKLFSNDSKEIVYVKNRNKKSKRALLSDEFYLNLTENCEYFRSKRGYVTCSITSEEAEFPIAFSLIVYTDIEMVERLLRSIYRPQNYYCIHVDRKANTTFMKAISAIANCFENVFLTTERIDVKWGTISVLEPELVCMEHLWRYKKWKYFINLTGQEFPLKTNWELVQILKAYRGANDLEGTVKRAKKSKWRHAPPFNLTAVKGSVHIVVNRDFIDFVLHDARVKAIFTWANTTNVPDESFFSTLNHNPVLGIRGSYKGEPETDTIKKPFLTRFKNWRGPPSDWPCSSHFFRGICILSSGDLPILGKAKHMFANKFLLQEDPIVVDCLEEMLFNNTMREFKGDKHFDSTYYSQLGFVLNQVE